MTAGLASLRSRAAGCLCLLLLIPLATNARAQVSDARHAGQRAVLDRPHALLGKTADVVSSRRGDPVALPFRDGATGQRRQPVATKRSIDADVGDTLSFNTPLIFSSGWERQNFTLVAEGGSIRLWVATEDVTANTVSQANIDAAMERLLTSTPPGSVNESAGIVENNAALFGETTNYDGDGIVDVLWFDIPDDYTGPETPFTPVLATAADIDPGAAAGVGNQADILYLDTFPTLTGEVGGIDLAIGSMAGGLQALIQLNYDPDENTFIRVAQFEWAKVINGFDGPSATYLEQYQEHNIGFLTYEGYVGDRARGLLFMRYAADQLGTEVVGALTRDTSSAASGLANMLEAAGETRPLGRFIADFHTANFVVDRSVDAAYGYSYDDLSEPFALPTLDIEGSSSTESPLGAVTMQPGGVQYVRWQNVRDFQITVDAVTAAERDAIIARAVVVPSTGTVEVVDLELSGTPTLFAGAHDFVTLILIHSDLARGPVAVTASATWEGTAYNTTNVVRDDGLYQAEVANFISLGNGWRQAARFELPAGSVLSKAYVPLLFQNQFVNSSTGEFYGSPNDPRDFTVEVFADDGEGAPGELLFDREYVDPRQYAPVTDRTVRPVQIDLTEEAGVGAGHPIIYVAISDAGADDNVLLLGLSTYATEDVSLIYGPLTTSTPEWFDLWGLEVEGASLSGYVIPIRAQFRSQEPVAIESTPAHKTRFSISSVYPNPTSDRATVEMEVDSPGQVSVIVYDLLGREVIRTIAEVASPGRHPVELALGAIPAGSYFVRASLMRGTSARGTVTVGRQIFVVR